MLLPTACMSAEEAAAKARARCRPLLHRPESIDDLVVQMYRTALEDDCLYSMKAEELERIWEIPVVYSLNQRINFGDPAVRKKIQYSRLDIFVTKWDFAPTKDMHSIRKPFVSYNVNLTDHGVKTIGSLFPAGRFPTELPEPVKLEKKPRTIDMLAYPMPPFDKAGFRSAYRAKPGDQIQGKFNYLWKKGKRGMHVSTHSSGAVYDNRDLELITDRNSSAVMSDRYISSNYNIVSKNRKSGK